MGALTLLRCELRHNHLQAPAAMNWTELKTQFLSSYSSIEEQRNLLDIFKRRLLSKTHKEKKRYFSPELGIYGRRWHFPMGAEDMSMLQLPSSISRICYITCSHNCQQQRYSTAFLNAGYKTCLGNLAYTWTGLAARTKFYIAIMMPLMLI